MNATETTNYKFLAVVTEMKRVNPVWGKPEATAKVDLYDGMGSETCVEIPVTGIIDKLSHQFRYIVEIKFRPMMDNEKFEQTKSIE